MSSCTGRCHRNRTLSLPNITPPRRVMNYRQTIESNRTLVDDRQQAGDQGCTGTVVWAFWLHFHFATPGVVEDTPVSTGSTVSRFGDKEQRAGVAATKEMQLANEQLSAVSEAVNGAAAGHRQYLPAGIYQHRIRREALQHSMGRHLLSSNGTAGRVRTEIATVDEDNFTLSRRKFAPLFTVNRVVVKR